VFEELSFEVGGALLGEAEVGSCSFEPLLHLVDLVEEIERLSRLMLHSTACRSR
jgi:hypothetical protein